MFQRYVSRFHFSRFLGPLLCSALLPATAMAQAERADSKGFYVTLYGQYSRLGSSDLAETGALGAGNALSAKFGNGMGFGGDVGYRYANGWAAEIEWNYRSHSLDSLRQGETNVASAGDFASNIILVNGLRRFNTAGAWTPYLGAGIGWVEEIDIDLKPGAGGAKRGYSAGSKTAFQLIAGAEYALTPNWSLTSDARWLHVGSVKLENEAGNPGGLVDSLKYNPLSVQLGVRYNF
jgi:outer membrane autotransporter protein